MMPPSRGGSLISLLCYVLINKTIFHNISRQSKYILEILPWVSFLVEHRVLNTIVSQSKSVNMKLSATPSAASSKNTYVNYEVFILTTVILRKLARAHFNSSINTQTDVSRGSRVSE